MPGAPIEATTRVVQPSAARETMETLNAEAEGLHIRLRTQANGANPAAVVLISRR